MNDPIIDDQLASLNLDFLVSMLFLLIITSSIISIAEGRLMTTEKTEQLAEARLISEKVAHIIEVVYSNGEGHEIRIKMPSSVKGSNYLVKVNQSGVLVMVGGRRGHSFSYRKRITSYTTNQTSVFMFPKKSYIIRNMKVNNNSHAVTISEG
ncbi:MAG: hypothetical protein QM396_07040 [Euryarchaeota archaeon]|jgi:hypothetical protein|nr:hypothetical protein [Euryarchaeota archaeon]HHT18894.1 hypothetical protein [Methanobacterium sp.]